MLEKIILASIVRNNEFDPNICLLVSSLRKFGGKLSEIPIWVFVPNSTNNIHEGLKIYLELLNVKFFVYNITSEESEFPLADLVLAASEAENLAIGKTNILVWLDANTLICNEPKEFLIENSIKLGYRPVHHTLIGSLYNEPLDSFWSLIYNKCQVDVNKIFPMKTHVDGRILRPYFNAGCLVVQPIAGLFKVWKEIFHQFYQDSDIEQFYHKKPVFKIFIHQVLLSCAILTFLEQNDLKELPFEYNFPLHLYAETNEEIQPKSFEKLVTARFEDINDPKWLEKIPLNTSLKYWLHNQLDIFKRMKK